MNKRCGIKLLSLLLLILTVSMLVMTACSTVTEDQSAGENESTAEETTSKYLDGLPETMDFGGETVRVICSTTDFYKFTERSIVSEELTGDIVDDAVYKRNQIVFDRLNADVQITKLVPGNSISVEVRQSVLANSDDYDLVAGYMYYDGGLAAEGMFYNFNDLPNLDFTQEYWSKRLIDGFSYKDATYWATGDLALRYIGGMYVTFINKAIWSDYLPDTDYYQLALDQQWTLDTLYEYSSVVYQDLDNDSIRDEDDMYGFVMNIEDTFVGLMTSCLAFISQKGDDGIPYIDIDYDRVVSYYEKMDELVNNNPGGKSWVMDDSHTVMRDFADGQMMCHINKLYFTETFLREMEDDYAILPMPKFDSEQESYHTTLHDGVTVFALPITTTKVELTTIMLEALAAESYRTVTPVYYEMALKVKYVRDDMSAIMIDLIRDGVISDFIFDFGSAVQTDGIGVTFRFRDLFNSGSKAYLSTLQSYELSWQVALEEFLANLEKYSS